MQMFTSLLLDPLQAHHLEFPYRDGIGHSSSPKPSILVLSSLETPLIGIASVDEVNFW